jgi:hypothetical protein
MDGMGNAGRRSIQLGSIAFPRARSRATRTSRAPSLARRSAATLPIPEVAPVITTALP